MPSASLKKKKKEKQEAAVAAGAAEGEVGRGVLAAVEEEAMPAEGKRVAGLRAREDGRLPPRRFAGAVRASEDFVHSLGIQRRLRKHKGAVNTISFNSCGSLLLSASDDETAVLWSMEEAAPALMFHTGHGNDVLHAQFMPLSDDRSIVTCGADAEVRHSQVQEGGSVLTDKLAYLRCMVHQLAVEPGSPHKFFSCVADGSVWHFDLREKHPRKLFRCGAVRGFDYLSGDTMKLCAIAIDPRNHSFFAVAGGDEYVRLYDARKIEMERSKFGLPVEQFCPQHLVSEKGDVITGLAYSQTGELLASYRNDNIYLFEREHGLYFNDFDEFHSEKLPVPRSFKGHLNMQGVKGVSFLGPNCEYVTSGSDCGHVFIWRKKDGKLVRVMKGDTRIVNCVEQHPHEIVIASCGINTDVKIWAPDYNENPSTAPLDEDSVDAGDYMLSARYDSSSAEDEDEDEDDDDDDDDEEDDDNDDYDEDEDDDEIWTDIEMQMGRNLLKPIADI